MTTVALIPTYNEVAELPVAVEALRNQTTPPDRIIAVVNNAAPGLLEVAHATGAEVVDAGRCPRHKAQALNHALRAILPGLGDGDVILVADADGTLAPTWLETAHAHIDAQTVIGGLFLGEPGGGWLGKAQRNEYRSYTREVYARSDRAWVLTGTATAFQARHARALIEQRGHVYDEHVATEDFELSVALKTMGLACVSPRGCEVTTEVMPTARQLIDQRTRWYRGALEVIKAHGLTRVTLPYVGQQAKILLGLVLSWAATALVAWFAATGALVVTPLWLIALAPIAYRIVAGEHRWFSATVLPELAYDLILQVALIRGWSQLATRPATWNALETA